MGFSSVNTPWSFYFVLGPCWHWKYRDEKDGGVNSEACVLGGIVLHPHSYVEALTPKCDCIWRRGL